MFSAATACFLFPGRQRRGPGYAARVRRRSLIAAIAACLCLGAVITVLVAFACAAWSPVTQMRNDVGDLMPPDPELGIPPPRLVRQNPEAQGDIFIGVYEHSGVGLSWQTVMVDDAIPGLDKIDVDHKLYRVRAGWPFRATGCSATQNILKPAVIDRGLPIPALFRPAQRGWPWWTGALFPLKPMPGFALDTLIYAAACFPLFGGIRIARRALRARKGRCPACAYSRTGLPPGSPCPECGTGTAR